jgi:hypothetical protein
MGKAGIVALGCALALLALGCGDRSEPKGDAAPEAAASAEGKPGAKVRKRTPPPAEIARGELPKFFPSDVPQFPGSTPKTSMMVGERAFSVFTTSAPIADVLAHYREQLPANGWTVDKASEKPPRILAHKEGRKVTLSVSRKATETEIGISFSGG